jgi:hypothetical protein
VDRRELAGRGVLRQVEGEDAGHIKPFREMGRSKRFGMEENQVWLAGLRRGPGVGDVTTLHGADLRKEPPSGSDGLEPVPSVLHGGLSVLRVHEPDHVIVQVGVPQAMVLDERGKMLTEWPLAARPFPSAT